MKKIFQTIFIFSIIALFSSLAVIDFASGDIANSLDILLGSTSTDQSAPTSTVPTQDAVPDFEKIVVGNSNDNYIFLGNNEISGIVTNQKVAFGVQTSGELGSFIGLNADTGMVIENSGYLGLMGLSTALGGEGIKVSDASDIGIYANGKSIGLYSQGTMYGLNITTSGYGGVLGSSGEGTGVIGMGAVNGVKLSDGSYLGGSGIGIFSNSDAFVGENYATFTINADATLADLNTTDLYVSETASFGIFDAASAKAKDDQIDLVGSLDMVGNDLSVTKGVTIAGGTSGSNSVGGDLIFFDYTSNIKLEPYSGTNFSILANSVVIEGDMFVKKDLTANEMGNITIHDQTATGSNASAQVSCESQQTIMGCGASIDSGSADITEVYPTADGSCYAKSLGNSSTLHVYAYCFEPGGEGSGSGEDAECESLTFTTAEVFADTPTTLNVVVEPDGYRPDIKWRTSDDMGSFNDATVHGLGSNPYESGSTTSVFFDNGTAGENILVQDLNSPLFECQDLLTISGCGDGYIDIDSGEECDGGPSCNNDCTIIDTPDPCPDPDDCPPPSWIYIPFYTDASLDDFDYAWSWSWIPSCEPPNCRPDDTGDLDVISVDCGGTSESCNGSETKAGETINDLINDTNSIMYGWNGMGIDENGNSYALGNLTTAGTAYMMKEDRLTNDQLKNMGEDEYNAAYDFLGSYSFDDNGNIVTGAYTGRDALNNKRTTGAGGAGDIIQP